MIPDARLRELLRVAEQYPYVKEFLEPSAAFRDVAELLRELLERRTKA